MNAELNEKMKSAFSGGKAKVLGITMCAALILSAGTLTAMAATNENTLPAFPLFQPGEKAASLPVSNDGAGVSFSTDVGGTWSGTWSDTAHEGTAHAVKTALPYLPQGDDAERHISWEGIESLHESLHMLRIDAEDGAIYHSLDGGETWIEGLPEGMTMTSGPDEVTVSFEVFEPEDGSDMMFKHTLRHTVTIDE